MHGARTWVRAKTSFVGGRVATPATTRKAATRKSASRRTCVTNAKYGDDGKYFDLNVSSFWETHTRARARALPLILFVSLPPPPPRAF